MNSWLLMLTYIDCSIGYNENSILQLVQGFGKIKNVSSITACLPVPTKAGNPIPWGILPTNLTKIWENAGQGHSESKLLWVDTERNYSLNYKKVNGSVTACNVTKPPTSWVKEIMYQPSGDQTNIPWGCQIPKVWKNVQKGSWELMSSTGCCTEFTGMKGSPEDPLQVEVNYSNIEEMRKKNTVNKPQWNCTRLCNCSSTE